MRAERNPAEEPATGRVAGVARDISLDGDAPDDGRAEPESEHRHPHPHIPHPHLIDPAEDRWKWRAKIRRDPRKLFFYRIAVGVAGLLLMIAAVLTGPFPGPGGIPLFLLGLAVWSSEFEWAQNVMLWFKKQVDRYRRWSRKRRIGFWLLFLACAWSGGYVTMIVAGIPSWLPSQVEDFLATFPGLSRG